MASEVVRCGDVLDISVVTERLAEFRDVLENQKEIELSAGELQRIDGAGIQILVALFRQAEQEQKEISWKDTSDSLLSAASLLGVSEELHLN